MAERIRFHLDEHIDPDVARALRQYGIDVTTTAAAKLLNQPDTEHIAFIRKEKRVIVTGMQTSFVLPVLKMIIQVLFIVPILVSPLILVWPFNMWLKLTAKTLSKTFRLF